MTNTTITITVSVPDEHLNPCDGSFVCNLNDFSDAMGVNNYEHTITITGICSICECGVPITRTTKYRGFETI